jgi:hypothetical protein
MISFSRQISGLQGNSIPLPRICTYLEAENYFDSGVVILIAKQVSVSLLFKGSNFSRSSKNLAGIEMARLTVPGIWGQTGQRFPKRSPPN